MEKDNSELVTQLEYYFSDKNLEYDEFFFGEIEASAERFLKLEIVLNCNKIKKMGSTHSDLQAAVEKSEILELSEDRESGRRIDKVLPEFKGTRKQFAMQTRSSRKNSEKVHNDTEEQEEDKSKYFAPLLLVIPDVTGLPKNGKLIEDTIGKQYNCVVPYARINRSNGHVVFDKNATEAGLIEKLMTEGFELEGNKCVLVESDDRERNLFNKENLTYLEKIVKKKLGKTVKKAGKALEKKLFNSLEFAGKKYSNFSGLQTQFKNIISKTRNGADLGDSDVDMLKELLKFHDNSAEKLKGVKGFTVDFHPTYKQTRCFFIVREDDTKEDFSLHKCLNNLKEKLINE